jgi:diguanylate cyclase (GGDEF)-like protein
MVARLQGDWAAARRLLPLADERARSAHLPHVRGHVLDEGVRLEMAAGDALRALHWARQGTEHWKQQLARRAEWLTRSAQLFDELETSRGEAVGLRQRAQVLEDEALHDPLTGALNRRGLDAAWRARPNGQLALLMLDADHFKRVNDRFGHPLGDAVLRVLVERIRGMARQGDAMVRWGGEEFLLLLPGANELGARLLGERLREAVQGHAWHGLAAGLQVTISLGLATWDGQEPLSELIARADAALYEAKQQGRNRLVVAGTRPA